MRLRDTRDRSRWHCHANPGYYASPFTGRPARRLNMVTTRCDSTALFNWPMCGRPFANVMPVDHAPVSYTHLTLPTIA